MTAANGLLTLEELAQIALRSRQIFARGLTQVESDRCALLRHIEALSTHETSAVSGVLPAKPENCTVIRIEVLRALFDHATTDKQFPIDEPYKQYLRETMRALATGYYETITSNRTRQDER